MDRQQTSSSGKPSSTVALALLPKTVRLLRGALQGAQAADALCEFEVLAGNAAYQKGEHFFLTPARARRAYS